jgi:hypothetical protein
MVHPNHYYIYDNSSNGRPYKCGKYMGQLGQLITEINYTLEKCLEEIISNTNKGVLIYIHGFQADNYFFDRIGGYDISSKLFLPVQNKYDTVISLRWNSPPIYRMAREVAKEKGARFGSALNSTLELLNRKKIKISFLNHSMGNRVFFNLANALNIEATQSIDKVFCMAGDYESKEFAETDFPQLNRKNKDTLFYIYYRSDDNTLQIANKNIPYKRLGLTGAKITHDNITEINCTGLTDGKGVIDNIFKHRYFYTSPSIINELIEYL